jgi:predicted AlkP superfamily phosphohydrolase/phosphomutase
VDEEDREGPEEGKAPRLLVIGVDSVTFRLLKPLVGMGKLPTLGRLMEEGTHGVLLSTVPSVTPPGWTTSYTGVNPAKHNVFDFKDHTKYLEGEMKYEMGSVTSQSIKADPFWRILNKAGRTVGMVNAPMAYPAEEMDGYMIAGFPCPTEGEGLYQPPDLEEEIGRVVPDYKFYGTPEDLDQDKPARYIEGINRISTDRAKAAVHLIRTRPTDVAAMIFTEVDRVQHFFWNTWDETHPTHNADKAAFRSAIPDHYQVIDKGISDMMEAMGPGVPVMVYSDHGAASVTRHFYPNTYLIQEGVIVMKGDKGHKGDGGGDDGRRNGRSRKDVKESRFDRRRIEKTMKRMGIEGLIHKIPKSIRRLFPVVNFETVDWSSTKAYFSSASAQAFTINLRGREPEGCVEPGKDYDDAVEEVIGVLERMRDPGTGNSPFASIHRRQDLWEGPYLENGPDIVTVPAEGYVAHKDMKERVFEDVGQGWRDRSADHEREGIVILWGPGIKRGSQMMVHHIEDIAPTLLHMCDVPVPRYMDGQVMEDAFEEDWLAEHPVTLVGEEAFVGKQTDGPSMTVEEEELLKERLRGLGYLG